MFRLIFNFVLLIFSVSFGATTIKEIMRNYCTVPPYMDTSSKPNIILVMDYSGSMQEAAYYPCGEKWKYKNKVMKCLDQQNITYDKSKTYYGYFKPGVYYKYNSRGQYWEENTNCSVSEDNERIGKGKDCISGNFLNFVSMSRIDIALKALVGGKTRSCEKDTCLIFRGGYRKVYEEKSSCNIEIKPNQYWDNQEQYNEDNYDLTISISGDSCKLSSIDSAFLRIKSKKVKGVLQRNADLGNYSFFVFGDNRKGKIKLGINEYKNKGIDALISKITDELPYGGTPTGEALYEVYDYLKQSNDNDYESNSAYINRGSEIDPFYDKRFGKLIPCKKNAIILISDGEWNGNVDPLESGYYLHVDDLRSDLEGKQNVIIFSLFTFANSDAGKNSLESVAAAGSFVDLDGDNEPFDIDRTKSSKDIYFPTSNCNPNETYNDNCKEWDKDGDGIPNTYYYADNGEKFEKALIDILSAIVKYNYSGGSLGVMGEQSKDKGSIALSYRGSILAQAMFYSQKDGIDWLGKLYTYWYHFDTNTIREDTNKNKVLEIDKDNILIFSIENQKNLKISIYSPDDNRTKGTKIKDVNDPSETNYIFEPGEKLKDIQEDPDNNEYKRKIYYAKCNQGKECLKDFEYKGNSWESDFIVNGIPLLGLPEECLNSQDNNNDNGISCLKRNNDYEKIINYIRGKDYEGFRSRTINGKVWKLGDIIYSTPKIVEYKDKGESYIFVGANDGMLHVFKAGKLTREGLTKEGEVVKLTGDNLGEEVWSFIPLNVLPYLRFLTDPDYCHLYYVDLTPEIYKTRDNRVILIGGLRLGGATGNSDNRAINPPNWACPSSEKCIGLSSYFAIDITDPENPKFLWEFSHPDLGFAYSGGTMVFKKNATYVVFGSGPINYKGDSTQELKYFAVNLDNGDVSIINTTMGADTKTETESETETETKSETGGETETKTETETETETETKTETNNAFSGRMPKYAYDYNRDGISDYIFVGFARKIETKTETESETETETKSETGGETETKTETETETKSETGGETKTKTETETETKSETGDETETKTETETETETISYKWVGGLMKIDIRDNEPSSWEAESIQDLDGSQGAITARVTVDKCFNKDYLFFGSGRWFYKLEEAHDPERLYGLPIKCNESEGCNPVTTVVDANISNLCNEDTTSNLGGWYINLEKGSTQYLGERMITDPTLTNQNVVLFTTTEPINDLCGFGGRTRVWALNCATGQSIQDTCLNYPIEKDRLKGSLLLQLSGGNIEQINIKEVGDTNKSNNKATRWYIGTAPETSPPLVQGLKKGEILLWLEK